MLALTIVQ